MDLTVRCCCYCMRDSSDQTMNKGNKLVNLAIFLIHYVPQALKAMQNKSSSSDSCRNGCRRIRSLVVVSI